MSNVELEIPVNKFIKININLMEIVIMVITLLTIVGTAGLCGDLLILQIKKNT